MRKKRLKVFEQTRALLEMYVEHGPCSGLDIMSLIVHDVV